MPKELAPPAEEKTKVASNSYKIRRGDTLDRIAKQHGTTVKALRQLNGIKSRHSLRVGSTLRVPAKQDAPKLVASKAKSGKEKGDNKAEGNAKSPKQGKGNSSKKILYTVRPGDTLWIIAKKHQVDVAQLASWNRINTRTVLQRGQVLTIFVSG
jgi:membrane-bound lytic murein transglycosylase D